MSKPVDVLRDALYECGLVQPLSFSGKGGSVSIMCRQIQGQEKGWIATIDEMLSTDIGNVELHVCRRYVRKDGKMAFGWFIGLNASSGKAVNVALEKLSPILKQASSRFSNSVAEAPKTISEVPQPYRPDFKLKDFTDARPRTPEFSGPDPKVPKNAVFRLNATKEGFDMALPHVYGNDINRPAAGSNKGASVSGSGELFKGLNTGRNS